MIRWKNGVWKLNTESLREYIGHAFESMVVVKSARSQCERKRQIFQRSPRGLWAKWSMWGLGRRATGWSWNILWSWATRSHQRLLRSHQKDARANLIKFHQPRMGWSTVYKDKNCTDSDASDRLKSVKLWWFSKIKNLTRHLWRMLGNHLVILKISR